MLFELEKGYESNLVTFRIQTRAQDGLLMFSGPETADIQDYFAILLVNGSVRVAVHTGEQRVELTSAQPIADGLWHDVRVSRTRLTLGLRIDRNSEVVGSALETILPPLAATLDVSPRLWVGGLDDTTGWPTALVPLGFPLAAAACLETLVFDGARLLTPSMRASVVRTSQVQRCESPRFSGRDFIGTSGAAGSMETLEVGLVFQPATSDDATLFFKTGAASGDAFSLQIQSGLLTVLVVTAASVQRLASTAAGCDLFMLSLPSTTEFHVRASYSAKAGIITLECNGVSDTLETNVGQPLQLDARHWFGGVGNNTFSMMPGFTGCMRDLAVNGAFWFPSATDVLSPTLIACGN